MILYIIEPNQKGNWMEQIWTTLYCWNKAKRELIYVISKNLIYCWTKSNGGLNDELLNNLIYCWTKSNEELNGASLNNLTYCWTKPKEKLNCAILSSPTLYQLSWVELGWWPHDETQPCSIWILVWFNKI